MDPLLALTVFAVVFLAELPDKSLIASLVLSTRYPARWVWLGVSAAFLVHTVIAVSAGGVLRLLPHTLVEAVVSVLFAVGAYLLLRPSTGEDQEAADEVDSVVRRVGGTPAAARIVATCFGVVFVGEWGDVTQLATANLSARYGDVLSVGVGAALGEIAAASVAIFAGQQLLKRVPLGVVRRAAGLVLLAFAVIGIVRLLVVR